MPPVRWIADAATILRVAGDRVNWDRLLAEADERLLTVVLREAVSLLTELVDAPVPASAVARLRGALWQVLTVCLSAAISLVGVGVVHDAGALSVEMGSGAARGVHDYSFPDDYWRFVSDLWRSLGSTVAPKAHIVIRLGSARISPDELRQQLVATSRFAGREVKLLHSEVSAIEGRQTDVFRPGAGGCKVEVDCLFNVSGYRSTGG